MMAVPWIVVVDEGDPISTTVTVFPPRVKVVPVDGIILFVLIPTPLTINAPVEFAMVVSAVPVVLIWVVPNKLTGFIVEPRFVTKTEPSPCVLILVAPITEVDPRKMVVPVTSRPPDDIVCVLVKIFVESSFA